MRVLAILALVAVFLAVSVQGRVVSRVQKALTESAVQAGGPLSYGFACSGVNDASCNGGLKCEPDSGTPPQPKTGFICLLPGEGDLNGGVTEAVVKQKEATTAAASCAPSTWKTKKTREGCECEAQCTPGFVCKDNNDGKMSKCHPPPAPLPTAVTEPDQPGPIPGGENTDCSSTKTCSVGICMTKAAYLCRLTTGKDTQSCAHVYKSGEKMSCRVVYQEPIIAPPANKCSNKGEYHFWQGPNALSNGDADARGFFKIGAVDTAFAPCCTGSKIATPSAYKGQYGVVFGKLAQCA